MVETQQVRGLGGGQRNEVDAVGVLLDPLGGDLEGHPGLPRAPQSYQRHQPAPRVLQQSPDLRHLLLPAHEVCRLGWQVVGVGGEGVEWWELLERQVRVHEAIQLQGLVQALQHVNSQVLDLGARGEVAESDCVCGDDDLSAPSRSHDPGGTVNHWAEVVILPLFGDPGVQPHADAYLSDISPLGSLEALLNGKCAL